MGYVHGKQFECEIEQSKPLPPLDYHIHTPEENFEYLHILFSNKQELFERQFEKKNRTKKETYGDD